MLLETIGPSTAPKQQSSGDLVVTTDHAPPARRPYWPELDVLRGLAAVLMVYNHAGVRWPRGAGHAFADALEFAGSLAPVVFFVVTGLGRGVQSAATGTRRPLADTLRKVLLLVLADVALWIAPGRYVGMDFLGFIGISALCVELIARSARPQRVAMCAFFAVLGLRVVAAPLLRQTLGEGPVMFLLGDHPIAGFSYPPCPWLAYAILGYLLGSAAQRHQELVRARGNRVLVACALLGAGLGAVCVAMVWRGALFFRWGTVSVAFTVLSLAAVFASISLAMACSRQRLLTRVLALPGTSSLVVVPLHYGLIQLAMSTWPAVAADGRFPLVATGLVVMALFLARLVDRWIVGVVTPRTCATYWGVGLISAVTLLVATYCADGTAARLPCMMAAQLVLCGMFAMRTKTA